MTKYISFSPYYSGFSNIIMNYECVFAIAYITKRKVILPPNLWSLFISESQDPKDYIDIFEVFDKDYIMSEFDCIDFYDVPEFKGKYDLMSGHNDEDVDYKSYTNHIGKVIPETRVINFTLPSGVHQEEPNTLSVSNVVLTNDDYENNSDFDDFSQDRTYLNLSKYEDKIIHFENNLFGHYWYSIYPGDENERNKMKTKINKCFRYSEKITELSYKIFRIIGRYNAIHVRRSDFLFTQTNTIEPVSSPEKLKRMVEFFFPTDLPLYISTDETDKSFFSELEELYDICFYEDFDYDLNALEKVALEQTICSNAHSFIGTYNSTFTKRINVMRGLQCRQADDDIGLNYFPIDSRQDVVTANPWKLTPGKKWNWNQSSHPQWKIERNKKYI